MKLVTSTFCVGTVCRRLLADMAPARRPVRYYSECDKLVILYHLFDSVITSARAGCILNFGCKSVHTRLWICGICNNSGCRVILAQSV